MSNNSRFMAYGSAWLAKIMRVKKEEEEEEEGAEIKNMFVVV